MDDGALYNQGKLPAAFSGNCSFRPMCSRSVGSAINQRPKNHYCFGLSCIRGGINARPLAVDSIQTLT